MTNRRVVHHNLLTVDFETPDIEMIRRFPSLTALKAFDALARQKSFKDAAAELNVTTSAISHQIRQLETELGCRLVLRGKPGFTLTSEGEELAQTVKRAFTRISHTVEKISSATKRSLTLQVYSTFAVRWLLPRVSEFESAHPEIALQIITSQQDADLSNGEVDACVLIGEPQKENTAYEYLFQSQVYPVCSPEYLEREPRMKRPGDLSKHTLLQVYPSQDDWSVWLEAVGAGHVDAAGYNRFDSYDHALNMAANSHGIALAIEPFAETDLSSGRLVELFPGKRVQLPSSWYFASLKSRKEDPKIVALRDWLVQSLAEWRTSTQVPA